MMDWCPQSAGVGAVVACGSGAHREVVGRAVFVFAWCCVSSIACCDFLRLYPAPAFPSCHLNTLRSGLAGGSFLCKGFAHENDLYS